MAESLSARRQEILKIIVEEYTVSAVPVASETVARRYELGVGAATIRNEMAVLEELGFINHPHTSAGRVPSELGYRYYVEHLMAAPVLAPAEQRMIRHQFHQAHPEMEQWVHLAAAVMVRVAGNLAVISPPRARDVRLRHVELVSIQPEVALLVVVLSDGGLKQQLLHLDQPATQGELSLVAHKVTERLAGRTREEIGAAEPARTEDELCVSGQVVEALRQAELQSDFEIWRDGIGSMLGQPEFARVERARQALMVLDDSRVLGSVLHSAENARGITVVIGAENPISELREYSVVLAQYGGTGRVVGAMALLGPTRMEYRRSISAVNYVSMMMSELISRFFG